jgi:hypothetical protein
VVHITEIHLTQDGDVAGEDSYRPADLCDVCTDVIKTGLGTALRMVQHYPAEGDEMRAVPVQDRLVMLPADRERP